MKPGTRIEVLGFDINNQEVWEPAKIGRLNRKHSTPIPGFEPVTFDLDGARLMVHVNRFRVVDNR
jgi:hypothetical protein